jgi:NAD(P)-dependent dehydrogenase (short-subunit alcohol dehydrogenase family)
MLEGKVAVVTGGASGIGLATANRLAAEGARLVIVDRNEEAGKVAATDVQGRFVRADVGNPDDWSAVVAEAEDAFGGIDLAYLNAGVTTQQPDICAVTDVVGPARERLKEAGFAMIAPDDIADAVVRCMTGGAESGDCLVCQAGREPHAHDFGAGPGARG